MTLENCIKYMNQAKDDETKKFWEERCKKKKGYVKPKLKTVKKVKKVDKE